MRWRDTPPQWGQGSEGYARRFASAEGFTAAHNGIALMFDLGFHLDPRYRRMPGAAFGARLRNAVGQTFIANKDSGGKMINVSEIAGNFGAGFIANSWYPAGYNSAWPMLSREGAFWARVSDGEERRPRIPPRYLASGQTYVLGQRLSLETLVREAGVSTSITRGEAVLVGRLQRGSKNVTNNLLHYACSKVQIHRWFFESFYVLFVV